MKLISRYNTPLLSLYGAKIVHWKNKKEVAASKAWFKETYPHTYKDVKEGEVFIVWNGDSTPVPFTQLKDETPDKSNRPTRLLDGCYYSLKPDHPIRKSTPEEIAALKKEIKAIFN